MRPDWRKVCRRAIVRPTAAKPGIHVDLHDETGTKSLTRLTKINAGWFGDGYQYETSRQYSEILVQHICRNPPEDANRIRAR